MSLPDLPRVRGDEKLLRQVFDQLFENALEHGGPQLELLAEVKGGWCTLPDGTVIEEWALFRRDHPQK